MTSSHEAPSPNHLLFALIGGALHLVVGLMVFASTLVVPLWAVVALGTVWLVAAVWSVRSWRRSQFAPLLAAVATSVVWILTLTLGERLLDWNA